MEECPKCKSKLTKRTNIKHIDNKLFAYLCGNCGFRVTFDDDEELEEKLHNLGEQ